MFDSRTLREYSLSLLESSESKEIQQRLELFQVFSKLYEHHRSLLNEILELEKVGSKASNRTGLLRYIQGVVSDQRAYLLTNLVDGYSKALIQPCHIWTLGRDPSKSSVAIRDKRLSRCHAAIQYVQHQGFVLHDIKSTNGTFVNGERVHHQCPLKDGDLIRLGSLTFSFFLCHQFQVVIPPSPEVLKQLENDHVPPTAPSDEDSLSSEYAHLRNSRSDLDPNTMAEETVNFRCPGKYN